MSLTLVMQAMLLMPAGMLSIMLVMGVVLPPRVRVPRMLTMCIVGAASFLGQ